MSRRTPLVVLVPVLLFGLAGCGSEEAAPETEPAVTGPACYYPADGTSPAKDVSPPPDNALAIGDVTAVLHTSQGDLTATLDGAATPCTVSSFMSLASQGYFDGTSCHRLTTAGIFVLQCGDPTGTGSGGPGYSFPDELTGQEKYPAGTLAMANAGPDTNGSQFFLVYEETPLPASYTVFGSIDAASVAVLQEVAAAGSDEAFGPGDGHPSQQVTITSVDLS